MVLSMVWIRQFPNYHYIMRLYDQFSPLDGLQCSFYSRISASGEDVGEHTVNVLELKNEVQLLLFYILTLCRMSSDEEKSTSPVLPKDSVRGSSVSSDLQVGKETTSFGSLSWHFIWQRIIIRKLTKFTSFSCFTCTGE